MREVWGAFFDRDLVLDPVAQGTLSGTSFAVKDIFDIQGYVAGAGSPEWQRSHDAAAGHAEAIELLLRQGARLTGTTQTDELMFSLNGENYHYGTPINPKAPQRIPGGSSSGSAVAVAAGLVDFALGSDTGGSIRIPASYCGIYGIRPSHGLVSGQGMVPLAPPFDTVGWMARDAALLRRVGEALLPAEAGDADGPFRRLLVPEDALAVAGAAASEAMRPFIRQWSGLVGTAERVTVAEEGLARWKDAFRLLQGAAIKETHREWIMRERPRFGPGIAERFAWALTLNSDDMEPERQLRGRIRQRMKELLGADGVMVMPTAPGCAPLRNTGGPELEAIRASMLQLNCIAGLAGLPQMTLPFMELDGFPVGVSLIAGPGQDLRLLRLAEYIAQAGAAERGESHDE